MLWFAGRWPARTQGFDVCDVRDAYTTNACASSCIRQTVSLQDILTKRDTLNFENINIFERWRRGFPGDGDEYHLVHVVEEKLPKRIIPSRHKSYR